MTETSIKSLTHPDIAVGHGQLTRWIDDHKRWLADNEKGKRLVLRHWWLDNASLSHKDLREARFHHCIFNECHAHDTNLRIAHFEGCTFHSMEFHGANIGGILFAHCALKGAQFDGVKTSELTRFEACYIPSLQKQWLAGVQHTGVPMGRHPDDMEDE